MKVHIGDCNDVLASLAKESVQCCITSPPYFGLRDYGVAGQIGQEDSVEAYVDSLVQVFRGVRRVLKDDGTLWLNLGDSYASTGGNHAGRRDQQGVGARRVLDAGAGDSGNRRPPLGLKAKDLIGIPWRVAFALQADGWYLRQDIIWHKPNPMPESVRDRCTRSHEFVFMLSKQPKYYYNHEAIKEPSVRRPQNRNTPRSEHPKGDAGRPAHRRPEGGTSYTTRNKRDVWSIAVASGKKHGAHFAVFPEALVEPCILAGSRPGDTILDPFGGSGTTGVVAKRLDRDFTLIELNPEYANIAIERIGECKRVQHASGS